MNDELKNWLSENLKEGISINEDLFKSPLDNIKDGQQARDYIMNNKSLLPGLDSIIQERVKKHDETFMADKLPGLIKDSNDKLRLELNPKETETDKRLRALEDSNIAKDKIIATGQIKEALTIKAKEIGFDTERAGRYSIYGNDAETKMTEDHEWITNRVNSELEKKLKGSVDEGDPQKGGDNSDNDSDFNSTMKDKMNRIRH